MTDGDDTYDRLPVVNLACAICRRVGLDPDDVAELRIRPRRMVAIVYRRNDDGHKYIDGHGRPATDVWEFLLEPLRKVPRG
jgi:hypothetical protein